MAELRTDYVDDVLDTSKNTIRKYKQIQNSNGTVSFVDVTEYLTVGTEFGAKDINDITKANNDLNKSLENIDTTFDVLYSTAKEFTTTTYVTITVGNMSGYKKIGFTYANSLDNANIIGNNQYGEIPFGIFKQGIRAYARMNDDCEMYFRYVDNTHVQIRTANISQKVSIKYVFGIK